MADDDGLRFVIADVDDEYVLELSGVDGSADLIANGIPSATFTLDDEDEAIGPVWATGSRCWVSFRGVERFRGRIREVPRDPESAQVTALVEGDLRKLWEWRAWPVPGSPITAQTVEYWTMTGPSETVFKAALSANFARLGVPWSCAPSLGRGSTVSVQLRMEPLAEKLVPLLDSDGLVITLDYVGDGVVVDVREPATVPGVFTLESGVPDKYGYNRTGHTGSRGVGGGRGEGAEREFVQVVLAEREPSWSELVELYVDVSNTEEGADLSLEVGQALAEASARVGVSTELVETDIFRYGTTYLEGDLVQVLIGPVDDLIPVSGVSVTESAGEGVLVTPQIGSADVAADTDVELARMVARLARGVRDQGRR